MSSLSRKLKDRRGETLVETLTSILLLALSAAMLAIMANTAIKINRDTALASALLYREISVAEQGEKQGSVSVAVRIDADTVAISADYTGASNELYSYSLPKKEAD